MPVEPGEMSGAENPPADMPQDELTLNDPLIGGPPAQEVGLDDTGLPQGVEWQEDEDPIAENFANEEEEILFGDPEGLGRNMPDVDVQNRSVPAHVVRRLPQLKRAASNPQAPAALKAAYRTLARRLEQELRG